MSEKTAVAQVVGRRWHGVESCMQSCRLSRAKMWVWIDSAVPVGKVPARGQRGGNGFLAGTSELWSAMLLRTGVSSHSFRHLRRTPYDRRTELQRARRQTSLATKVPEARPIGGPEVVLGNHSSWWAQGWEGRGLEAPHGTIEIRRSGMGAPLEASDEREQGKLTGR
ncbi:hypothetical protein GGTG_03975 [Gaeumannomyces tritici R3-111a-1]|uniref:Uncharacterized protein n=1 Tax=Gaeumannomyces tritici (strain R3-111a-1) TaxID=644352 RepID=J3NRS5_GAET3|nr:hypothetical protein GGTG_03975 [Gaeumannomyces tritici R3-111a-1]EJT78881.1 hypothetical protein GGTG_03975 [Gaeumannomyces tritici R3-111a-1]